MGNETAQHRQRRSMTAGRRAALLALPLLAMGAPALAQVSSGGGNSPAPAGAAPSDAPGLDDIVVTARFKRETVQQTPISMSVVSAADIAARGASNVIDVANSAPNVTVTSGGGYYGKSAQASIRGVGQQDYNYAFEPGVGFYIDDVYFGSVFGSIFNLGDIDRVEVERGPQGTLFGKNNEGGAIRIYTVDPKGDGSGYIQGGYGNYDHKTVKGAVDLPLGDTLALRLSGGYDHQDGYIKLLDYACANPGAAGTLTPTTTKSGCVVGHEGGSTVKTVQAVLKWKPAPNFTLRLKGDITDDDGQSGATTLLYIDSSPTNLLATYNANAAIPNYGLPADNRFVLANPYRAYAGYTNPATGRTDPQISNARNWGLSGIADWQLGGIHVRDILALRRSSGAFEADASMPVPLYLEITRPDYHQLTNELQISGNLFDNKLEWTVGAYYFKSHSTTAGNIELNYLTIVPPGILNAAGLYGLNFDIDDKADSRSVSGFAHAVYHFTDKLSLELGVRYSDERKTYSVYHTYTATDPVNFIFPVGAPVYVGGLSATAHTARADPKAAIQYQWTPTVMTYVQVATGYKGGGVNPRPTAASDFQPFGDEHLISYEAGLKSELFDRRLRFNASVFHSDYRDLQLNVFQPSGGSIVVNTGHVAINGVEAEMALKPVPAASINASVGYLDYDVRSLGSAAGVVGGPTLDSVAPNTPRWKASAGAQYRFDLGEAGGLTPRIDWTYQSKVYFDPANSALGAERGYSLLNGQISWTAKNEKWSAALTAANLTNKLYYVTKTVNLVSLGTIQGQPGRPRTVLFTVTRRF